MYKPIRRAELIKGGTAIKQGEIFTLGFQLFDANGLVIVPSVGQTIAVKIANVTGVVLETVATVVSDHIEFTVTENIGAGKMRVELTVGDGVNVLQKYPAKGYIELYISASLDDIGTGTIYTVTAAEMFTRIEGSELASAEAVQTAGEAVVFAESAVETAEAVRADFDLVVAEAGASNPEVVLARGGEVDLSARLATTDSQLTDIAVSAKKYGLKENGTWTENRDALQAANDAVASKGGGIVLVPPGTYTTKGIIQDSRVEFRGEGVTLVHPDGASIDIIKARVTLTNGAMALGTSVLTVDSAVGIEEGTVVAIRGAGGMSTLQNTSLVSAITNTQTTDITLTLTTGFANSGILLVGSEIIEYTGQSNGVLTGVTRGRYGTTPASHNAGATIGIAMRLIAEVMEVSGNTITLDRPAVIGVSASPVSIGILHPKITGIKFEGNRIQGGAASTHNAVRWDLVRFGRFDFSAENAEAAIYMAQGTRDCEGVIYAKDCSVPEAIKGAVVWMFQQCHRNHIYVNISGDLWSGVYLDNRTSLGTEWDGPCNDNSGVIKVVGKAHSPWIANTALLIVGGNRNVFELNAQKIRTGFVIESASQVYSANGLMPTAKGNKVDIRLHEVYQPWVLYSDGNTVSGYYESAANGVDTGSNLKFAVSLSSGANPILGTFPDGTQTNPGIAFGSETNTGFYKIAAGQMQYVSQGALIVRLRSNGILFAEGKGLEFGTVTGSMIGMGATQKLGFWGVTPVVKPSAIPNTTSATLVDLEAEVNKLKAMLRSIGLMS